MTKLAVYRLLAWMIGSLITFSGVAQLTLQVEMVEPGARPPHAFKSVFKSRKLLQDYLQQLPASLQAQGYLAASIDSTAEREDGITAYLFLGDRFEWQELRIKQSDRELLTSLGYHVSTIADATTIAVLPEKIISYFEENGHPFAKVQWDSLSLTGNRITASLRVDKGPLYKLDSIGIYGSLKISQRFLAQYLDLPRDGIYRKSTLDRIDQKLLELPYVQQTQPWNLTMQTTGYVLNFYLQPKRSNQVDALLGFLPSSQQNNGKLLLTVDAKLLLRNAFGSGETIDFNWEQIQPKSPRLHLVYQQPFVLRSPFGLDASFQLYKKDSSFLNIWGNLGVMYQLSNSQSVRVSLQTQRTNLLDVDTNSIRLNRQLPDIVDLSTVNLGIEYSFVNTSYRFNPRRGTEVLVSLSGGSKAIRRNNAITQIKDGSFNYASLYDSIRLNSYQVRARLTAAHYFPVARQGVLKTAVQAGLLQTPDYFRNEMFQIGGYRLLRGFDEESIFADRFAVATLEYRYLVGMNSFFFGFADLGYTGFKNDRAPASHTYAGFGAGMAFETGQGIFNISIALGKRDDTRFNFRQSKIHLGYTSFF